MGGSFLKQNDKGGKDNVPAGTSGFCVSFVLAILLILSFFLLVLEERMKEANKRDKEDKRG